MQKQIPIMNKQTIPPISIFSGIKVVMNKLTKEIALLKQKIVTYDNSENGHDNKNRVDWLASRDPCLIEELAKFHPNKFPSCWDFGLSQPAIQWPGCWASKNNKPSSFHTEWVINKKNRENMNNEGDNLGFMIPTLCFSAFYDKILTKCQTPMKNVAVLTCRSPKKQRNSLVCPFLLIVEDGVIILTA